MLYMTKPLRQQYFYESIAITKISVGRNFYICCVASADKKLVNAI